jgi:hypothetical protein
MKDDNENRNTSDDLDRTIDAVLAKYASVEPRAGLDERILANLRTADTRITDRGWWGWNVAAALAAVLIMMATLWRWSMPAPPIAVHPSAGQQTAPTESANREINITLKNIPSQSRDIRHRAKHEVVAANPKLDVFPSPLPLSEQEKLLAIYVAQFPERAELIAEARMADLQHEAEERQALAAEEQNQKQ